ncbi:MAG: hydroxyacylglutathione hydrolase [Methylophilaceae bacterium]
MLHIVPIPAFHDNYIWLLHNERDAVVIDPGDALPVLKMLDKLKLNLSTILITHHHSDHIDGVARLVKDYSAQVFAPQYEQYTFAHHPLAEGAKINLPKLRLTFEVLWLPGHTLGHIAYLNEGYLFCGDTLFSAGCGRLFEGSPTQMLNALNRLKNLNPLTKVYCTHEYTDKNIAFALTLEPDNQDLIERGKAVQHLRAENLPSLPSTIGLELRINPFLRCNQPTIVKNSKAENLDELSVFTKIRALRNHY